jgi:hypothetical protein
MLITGLNLIPEKVLESAGITIVIPHGRQRKQKTFWHHPLFHYKVLL